MPPMFCCIIITRAAVFDSSLKAAFQKSQTSSTLGAVSVEGLVLWRLWKTSYGEKFFWWPMTFYIYWRILLALFVLVWWILPWYYHIKQAVVQPPLKSYYKEPFFKAVKTDLRLSIAGWSLIRSPLVLRSFLVNLHDHFWFCRGNWLSLICRSINKSDCLRLKNSSSH